MPSYKLALSAFALTILAPSSQANDICNNVAQWSAQDVYTGDKTVTYDGTLWKAKWWTQNNKPGSNQVWANLGSCNGNVPDSKPNGDTEAGHCNSVPQWSAQDVYTGNKEVAYDGTLWKAKWWTQNDKPGSNEVWANLGSCNGKPVPSPQPTKPHGDTEGGICSDVPQWSAQDIYTGNKEAVYDAMRYGLA
ncbi:hypothetical protein K7432_014707 [Basidiobolus ranarum]|uniref:Chitin-binding type-3 domain-containing protein n=1 Tax=Basidiobolus ranarum TaxID=34480 RepID=A0ABR2WH86_9FUNG